MGCARAFVVSGVAVAMLGCASPGPKAGDDGREADATPDVVSTDARAASDGALTADAALPPCIYRPLPAEDAGAVTPAQAWCTPATVNPALCPASKPPPGSSCSTPSLLRCGYPEGSSGFLLETCSSPSGYWAEVAHTCADSCGLPDAAVLAVPGAPSCGSLAAVECQDTPFSTDQERANETLALLSQCCTGGDYQVTVTLVDGCATQIADSLPGGSSTGAFEQCLAAELAGRRLACATGLSCAGASLSGVQ